MGELCGRRLLARLVVAGVAVSALSCDQQQAFLYSSVALVNVTHQTLDLQVFRPPRALTCAAVADDPTVHSTNRYYFDASSELFGVGYVFRF